MFLRTLLVFVVFGVQLLQSEDKPDVIPDVEGQPLAANAERLSKALEFLGTSLPEATYKALQAAIEKQDAKAIQLALDEHVLVVVSINPESRVKAARGPANAKAQQAGYVPFLIKVVNESTVKAALNVTSPQAGARYSGAGRNESDPNADKRQPQRFIELERYTAPPLTKDLSGLKVEYALVLLYSSEAGKREVTLSFDVGGGSQDLGFRGEVPVLFEIAPAIPVRFRVQDSDGTPTTARFVITDKQGHVHPPQAKRLAPDLFFHQQIYRHDNGTVLLPPGEFSVEYGRGPEYLVQRKTITVVPAKPDASSQEFTIDLKRWIDPSTRGWYSGDHHIHAAGCAHYTSPTEGITPEDMYLHVKGEGMNVGCCLTWGPCYDHQRKFFNAKPWERSEPFTVLKYDVEVSGFGSQALGHVCLLNLRDQTYPGSEGTKNKGWPTWTTPLMTWAKEQGGVTGYAHSANGLQVDAEQTTRRLFTQIAGGKKGDFTKDDANEALVPLPEAFEQVDANRDSVVTEIELRQSINRTLGKLPNLAIPEMNGIGAQEVCVSTAHGVCDFISAMDTDRIAEWNCWYHILNCGFPLKVSGETDFPCISGSRVGMGRVYVQLGKVTAIDFSKWARGIAEGRSYVSDGYAHALEFTVNGVSSGPEDVKLERSGKVKVAAVVAFAEDPALGTAVGGRVDRKAKTKTVDVVVNGLTVKSFPIPADNKEHTIELELEVGQSSWIALRSTPQLHTNPVTVTVAGKPIRASAESAKWCIGVIEQLWRVRAQDIRQSERAAARKAFDEALAKYKLIAKESAKP